MNMSSKREECWSRQQTLKLIAEFKERELLYKVSHTDYMKVHKRKAALEEIAASLQHLKPEVTAAGVRRKIKVLQQQIAQEKKRIRAATSGGTEDLYISRLWCFNELRFLLDANDDVRVQSDMGTNGLDESFSKSEYSIGPKKIKRPKLDEISALRQSANKSIELVTSLIEKRSAAEESKEEIFCKLLCSELKELKMAESYDNVTTEMLLLVRRAKADERLGGVAYCTTDMV